jgi:aspartate/methionine/tyrosine aminotransferase
MCQAAPVSVPTYAEDEYNLSPSILKQYLDSHPNARCIILCNPSNPTGCLSEKEPLQAIANVLENYPNVSSIILLREKMVFLILHDVYIMSR